MFLILIVFRVIIQSNSGPVDVHMVKAPSSKECDELEHSSEHRYCYEEDELQIDERRFPLAESIEKLEPREPTVNPDLWFSCTSKVGVDDIFAEDLSSM